MTDSLTSALAGFFGSTEDHSPQPQPTEKSMWDRLNEERAQWRDAIAFLIANPGEGAEGDRGASSIHQVYAKDMTGNLGQVLPASVAGSAVDTTGIGNEALSGMLTWLAGKGYYGPKGYDQSDIDANRRGIAPVVAGLQSRGDPGYQTLSSARAEIPNAGVSQIISVIQALANSQRMSSTPGSVR